eukprot:3233907-Ditylum_brightwellii.AAC.1
MADMVQIPKNTRLDKNWPLDRALGQWTLADPLTHRNSYLDQGPNIMYVKNINGQYTKFEQAEGTDYSYKSTEAQ